MLKIGLTGGIGSGKTTVARLFAELGVPIIDADLVARDLVEPGRPALSAVIQAFGADFLVDGRLDRGALRELVFSTPSARARLEAILHPLVFSAMAQETESLDAPYGILVIPLLTETGSGKLVDRVLLVDCPEETQMERIRARDQLDREIAVKIIASQAGRGERLTLADDVILNTGELANLRESVMELHQRYQALSRTDAPRRAID